MDDRKLAATLQQAKQFLAEDLIADGATVHPRSSSTSYLIHVAQTRDTPGSRRALARYDAVASEVVCKCANSDGRVLWNSVGFGALLDRYGIAVSDLRPSRWQRFRSMIAAFWSRMRGR